MPRNERVRDFQKKLEALILEYSEDIGRCTSKQVSTHEDKYTYYKIEFKESF